MMLGLLFSLLTPLFTPITHAEETLKAVTLNFNSEAVPEDYRNHLRDKRFVAMTKWILENAPDIIFIEEGWNYRGTPSIVKALAESTGYDYHYRLTMGVNGLLLDSNGILLRPGHRFIEKKNFKLAHAKPTLGDGSTWIVSLGATAWGIGGKIITRGGSTVYAYATHLIGKTENERKDQINSLHEAISSQIRSQGETLDGARILIAGDMNLSPSSDAIQNLGSIGYEDSFQVAHPEAQFEAKVCTFCSDPTQDYFNPMTIGPNQVPAQGIIEGDLRIDYLFSKGPDFHAISSKIAFSEPLNGVWMSDHYGVESVFQIGSSNGTGSIEPQPEHDRMSSIPRARVIRVSDQDLNCHGLICSNSLGAMEASWASGVTFINDTKKMLQFKLQGTGRIYPSNMALIRPGHVAAFFFEPGHTYSFKSHHVLGRRILKGQIQTSAF